MRSYLEPDTARLGAVCGALLPIVDGHPTFAGSPMMTDYLRSGAAAQMQAERFGIDAERGITPETLVAAMDTEGIDVSAVYPSYGLHVPYCQDLDPALAIGLARAYNRWLGEFCSDTGGRVIPVALAPLHEPELAAQEIARSVQEDGARAIAPPGEIIHEVGGVCIGDDPSRSVLNSFCQSWEVDNLFVTDGGCFLSNADKNPTLSIMAVAWRATDYLVNELQRGSIG